MNKVKFSKGILLLLLNGTIALSKVPKVKTEEYLNPQNNKFTATDNLNMRSYNSKDSERIGKIKKNEEVEVLVSYDDDWDIVRYKDKIGFVNREFLNGIVEPNFDSEITLINGYVTATEDLRLRITPDTENEYIKAENQVIKKEIALREEKQAALLKAKKQQSSKNSAKKDIN